MYNVIEENYEHDAPTDKCWIVQNENDVTNYMIYYSKERAEEMCEGFNNALLHGFSYPT